MVCNAHLCLKVFFCSNKGENAIVIISGANNFLSPEDVNAASDMVATAKVVVCQLEVPLETTLKALEIGKKGGGSNELMFGCNVYTCVSYYSVQCCSWL